MSGEEEAGRPQRGRSFEGEGARIIWFLAGEHSEAYQAWRLVLGVAVRLGASGNQGSQSVGEEPHAAQITYAKGAAMAGIEERS